ncbi:CapA family protein [Nocardioides taihuensis]|uniref:CapA family protein n=1 Tax=Nocardioides taihuensis TaxID=1835606 RepID=A0ABW0BPG5_9ACTN
MTAPRCTRPRTHTGAGALAALAVTGGLLLAGCGGVAPEGAADERPETRAAPAPTGTSGGLAVDPATTDDPSDASVTTPEAAPREVTVAVAGDLLWHDTVWESAEEDHRRTGAGVGGMDFGPMFRALAPVVQDADLAVCHEEVPFAPRGGPYLGYPVFAAPPQIASFIGDFGWDACTTASNHSVDQGFTGLARTATLLDRQGVAHVGTFRTAAERRQPVLLQADGVTVGLVQGTFGLNGLPLPAEQPWSVSMWDADNLLAQARAARRAGADVVLVGVHWGSEYVHEPTPEQVALADRLTRSPDVDLVYGEHAHVVQPITKVNGKWVAYGLGNMVAQNEVSRPETYQGISATFTFAEQPDGSFEVSRAAYVPTAWNHYTPGNPIRITTDPTPGQLAQIRDAVHLLGGTGGLQED